MSTQNTWGGAEHFLKTHYKKKHQKNGYLDFILPKKISMKRKRKWENDGEFFNF